MRIIGKFRMAAAVAFGLAGGLVGRSEIPTIPESDQGRLATTILEAYNGALPGKPPKLLHVAYFTPSDREPEENYQQRLDAILENIQTFYRQGMERAGFGPKTFPLERNAEGKLRIYLIKGKRPERDYQKPDGEKILRECVPTLNAAGMLPEKETVLIFCNLGDWAEATKTFSHHSPYYGLWTQANGLCFAVDSAILNVDDLLRRDPILNDDEYGKMTLGKFNTVFIGGVAHELGHAFALPHCGERWDEKPLGTSLMGAGNRTYHDEQRGESKGSFLTLASAMRLASRPIFSGSVKNMLEDGRLLRCDLSLITNVTRSDLRARRGTLRLEGTVTGSTPVYGVVAYFDSLHDGGYSSPTATSVPDAQGRFALEVSDLAACDNGDLRVEFCHVNGAVSEKQLPFSVDAGGHVDIAAWETRRALEPLADAVAGNQEEGVAEALQRLEASPAPELAKAIGRNLAATVNPRPKPKPAELPPSVVELALGNARPERAAVGWLRPASNRVPLDHGVSSPWLDCGRLYATGLYAHAPSKYVFDLGGTWHRLSGLAGLHTLQQSFGSVIFIIKADDREVFRSDVIKGAALAQYNLNLKGVKKLELIVDPAADNNHNDWGLWLDPTLSR